MTNPFNLDFYRVVETFHASITKIFNSLMGLMSDSTAYCSLT